MKGKNTTYLMALICTQIITCLIMFVLLFFLSQKISSSNNDILRMLAVSDAETCMREMIDNTIVRIDLNRNLVKQEVMDLTDITISQIKRSDIQTIIKKIYPEVKKSKLGNTLDFLILEKKTGAVLLSSQGITLDNDKGLSQQVKKLSVDAAFFENISTDKHFIIIYVKQSKIDDIAKKQVYQELHQATYPNNEYIWVNEILNFDGGDDYAIRIIHPNLKDTEGNYLSTNTQDIAGNYPYLKELEGVKEKGDILQTYYFKNKTNNKISEKLSYAKLYEPFNWIIATGKTMDDMFIYANGLKEYNNIFIYNTIVLFLILTVGVFTIGIGFIAWWQKRFLSNIDTYVKIETERDYITETFTRKIGEKYFNEQIQNDVRINGFPLFIIIDIDNFKQINDKYGHDIGDIVLKKVSKIILSCIRNSDMLFRWGGDEFLLVCYGVKNKNQIAFTDKILSSVNSIVFESNQQKFSVSLSMGGSYVPIQTETIDHVKVIKNAHNALLRAKNTGKNKYCSDEM